MRTAYTLLIAVFTLLLIPEEMRTGIGPRFALIKNSSKLITPKTPDELQYRNLLAGLYLQETNCPGTIGNTRTQLFSAFGNQAYHILNKYYGVDSDILLLKKKAKLAGAIVFSANQAKHLLDITLLAIDQKHHRKGYGTLLLDELEKNHPGYTVRLSVFKENASARAFYQNRGFKLVGQGKHCFCLVKKLVQSNT
ncbi:MAG: hypothetical protein UV79_C0010G0006 [candidate division TM6 bacterium GW2011_GWF2_43_17]|nr:MAG: hypothetical protein UV79_C0010G0006 [candidate division TM6 bacterium GW2011_GWF2_43_17]HAU30441.1 hypothetical protein [Candidatus Dependentiae bacterium]